MSSIVCLRMRVVLFSIPMLIIGGGRLRPWVDKEKKIRIMDNYLLYTIIDDR